MHLRIVNLVWPIWRFRQGISARVWFKFEGIVRLFYCFALLFSSFLPTRGGANSFKPLKNQCNNNCSSLSLIHLALQEEETPKKTKETKKSPKKSTPKTTPKSPKKRKATASPKKLAKVKIGRTFCRNYF